MQRLREAIVRVYDASRLFLIGEPAPAALPARLNVAVADEQQRGERLVSWVEAAAVLIWTALYVLSRKTSPADAPFEPVPWTLTAYGLFIAARLMLSYRQRLADWQVALSIIVDISVLMLLIWSFHLQYRQPPAFYLKAPTLLYVFIFIALRALRFEPRWVLFAGLAAAIGWAILLFYSIAIEHGAAPITHDYVHYMTSASILLGAEFDKIVSILMVTVILALALRRARHLMVRCVFDHAAALELSRFLAGGVAKRITEAATTIEPGQAELRRAAVLFVDLRGFTPLARELPPASVMELLGTYQKRVIPAVGRCGGSIDKFLGDGIMASFGAVAPNRSYAADALRAADAVIEALDEWRVSRRALGLAAPRAGIAVTSGEVVFGTVGDESRLEYTVIGDAVNLAAKLEKCADADNVTAIVDRTTFELALTQGYTPGHPATYRQERIKGIKDPLEVVALSR